ncbi:ADP-ribosylglycohydrolase family protein [Peterkaempfera bronchialis]|uniref:ADP-ribosylglycohydrolase family protein n=2 Tax=Peterkaempfera bronchialis TaxID=2126346 RepID=A0A345T6Q5_9ACTN|nr:ADP-ribosylglycohydrolase family protein [Peterkaempfera bronchialis]AXI81660.1 ADP-ribosylglycohydrolase family protein [Peterkaempfera bronchialis]
MTDQPRTSTSEPLFDAPLFDHRSAACDALHGLAVGDAFGAQFFVPENRTALDERCLPPGPWPWTDDTEMACSVFDALRLRGSVDQWGLARSFARRHDFDRGYGPAMNRLLRQVREGGSWRDLAAGLFDGQGSFGNGSAMRVAPLGAWFAVDLEEAAWQAARSAEVTHTHPEAVAGAVAVAVAAACAARSRGRRITPQELLQPVVELTPAGKVRDGAAEALSLTDQPHVELAAHRLGNGRLVSAVDTVPFTLWCAARHLDDYEAALWATASAGGDVDTTCAIVGGILASRLGVDGIPRHWHDTVEPLPPWLEPDRLGTDASPTDFPQTVPIKHPKPIQPPDLVWTPGEWQRIRHGVRAQAMEEKWNAYLADDRLLLSRSSTDHCLFEVAVEPTADGWRPVSAWVESARDRYRRGTDEAESAFLEMLLNMYFGKADRPELWERYRRLRFGG